MTQNVIYVNGVDYMVDVKSEQGTWTWKARSLGLVVGNPLTGSLPGHVPFDELWEALTDAVAAAVKARRP